MLRRMRWGRGKGEILPCKGRGGWTTRRIEQARSSPGLGEKKWGESSPLSPQQQLHDIDCITIQVRTPAPREFGIIS